MYREDTARDVYVYPEQAPEYVDEDVDCTPFNTVTTVQHVPITEVRLVLRYKYYLQII